MDSSRVLGLDRTQNRVVDHALEVGAEAMTAPERVDVDALVKIITAIPENPHSREAAMKQVRALGAERDEAERLEVAWGRACRAIFAQRRKEHPWKRGDPEIVRALQDMGDSLRSGSPPNVDEVLTARLEAVESERDAANALLMDWIAGEPDAETRTRANLRKAGLLK